MDDSSVRKRRTALKACRRCHRRKQRCVGYPTCANCQTAEVTCARDPVPVSRRFAGLSKQELVEKLEVLSADREACQNSAKSSASPSTPPIDGPDDAYLAPNAGRVPVASQNNPNPSSSGSDAAQNTHGGQNTHASASWDAAPPRAFALGAFDPSLSGEDLVEKAPRPDDELGASLLSTYLENIHRRTPYLDFGAILRIHGRRHQDIPPDAHSRYDCFKLYMVYAIAATVLRLTRPYTSTLPEQYFATALPFKDALKGADAVQEIEALLLIISYRLRTTVHSRIWHLVGLAMRTAVEIGMHREHYYRALEPRVANRRRRIFWSTYTLERNIAWSLRRPFSVSDHDIDTAETVDADYNVPDTLADAYALSNPTARSPRQPGHLNASTAAFRLIRAMSRAYVKIHRVDTPVPELKKQVPPLLEQIRQWTDLLPQIAESDHEWVLMHYNDSVRKLIEPFLRILSPQDELIGTCLQAAGRMCRLFKEMRMRKLSTCSFLMINSVFVAGMDIW